MSGESHRRNRECVVHLENVQKVYSSGGTRTTVFSGIDAEVFQGEMVVIRGVSGVGKSTLLNIIGGIDTASGGAVTVCGAPLTTMTSASMTTFRRERVGFVFQFYNLLPTLTALENVTLGLEASRELNSRAAAGKTQAVLEAVGLAQKADRFPGQLSGGEQQRVAIARALAKEPPLILADEPTGNLDEQAGRGVLELFSRITRDHGTTLLVATHDPSISAYADRTLSLKRDGLVEHSPVREPGSEPPG